MEELLLLFIQEEDSSHLAQDLSRELVAFHL